jgi:molybdopterin-guanine dinucleotide biosynthesis protein A
MSSGFIRSAVVLAGGRSSRLGGTPKAGLHYRGRTLLDTAVSAVRSAGVEAVAVVGPPEVASLLAADAGVLLTREEPPFGGPVAGISAGIQVLPHREGFTAVLACDMPAADVLMQQLQAAAQVPWSARVDGFMAVDGGTVQPLAALYRTSALRSALSRARSEGRLENASVFSLIASLDMVRVEVPPGCTADVDDWAAARTIGITEAADAAG